MTPPVLEKVGRISLSSSSDSDVWSIYPSIQCVGLNSQNGYRLPDLASAQLARY